MTVAIDTGKKALLEIEGLSKSYGKTEALSDFSLTVAEGDFVVLVGPSGCGKSTLLRLVAGLEVPSTGRLFLAGKEITELDPSRRNMAMVFQDYALYPHMTAFQNIAFPLKVRHRSREQIRQEVLRVAEMLDLQGDLEKRPGQLSGGQQQRVAIGRALVRKPALFLMDEPLSNLDARLRVQLRGELAKLHRDLGATILYVTHDQTEALALATKVVVLDSGVIQQIGAPFELYENPANTFVAGFVGNPPMNLISAELTDGALADWCGDRGGLKRRLPRLPKSVVGVRPEHSRIVSPNVKYARSEIGVRAVFLRAEFAGADRYVFAERGSKILVARLPEEKAAPFRAGQEITVRFNIEDALFFDAKSGVCLGGRGADICAMRAID